MITRIAMVASLGLAQAADFNEPALTDICPSLGDMAEQIMRARQRGVSMSEMMQLMPVDDGSDPVIPVARLMVISAFEGPRFQTERHQWRTIEDFRADWELICYQQTLDGGTRN